MKTAGLGLALLAVGCTEAGDLDGDPLRSADLVPPTQFSAVPAPNDAYCDVTVEGAGVLDLETEYLPNVVFCENNGANLEALKAQAIAARSVAYYAMATDGSICDSQGCQVYSCGGSPGAIHMQAVEETSGLYLRYNDILTYGFYVAGDPNVQPAACIGAPGGGPTEQWVTYNEGNVGTAVEQTNLGFVFPTGDPGYGQNRGCMAQWGARCLENNNNYDATEILQFFYGDDIEIVQAQGDCVLDLGPMDDDGADDVAGESDGAADTDGGESSGDDGAADAGDDRPGDDAGDDADDGADGGDALDGDGDGDADGEDDGPDPDDDGVGDDDAGGTGGTGAWPLPDTFGARGNDEAGCACRTSTTGGGRLPMPLLAGVALLGLLRRRC